MQHISMHTLDLLILNITEEQFTTLKENIIAHIQEEIRCEVFPSHLILCAQK